MKTTKIYVLMEYYNNGMDWEDKYEHEEILRAFMNLNDALKYKGKSFTKNTENEFYGDFMYISRNEYLEEGDYLNYRIYEVEVQE